MAPLRAKIRPLSITVALAAAAVATAEPIAVTGRGGTLTVDSQKGFSLSPECDDAPASQATEEAFWAITLENAPAPGSKLATVEIDSTLQEPARVKRTRDGGVTLRYDSLKDASGKKWPIALSLSVKAADSAFELSGRLRNDADGWIVNAFSGPVLTGIRADLARTPLLLPYGFGLKVSAVPESRKSDGIWFVSPAGHITDYLYPCPKATMPWYTFAGSKGGLYFGSHDPQRGAKHLCIKHITEKKTFSTMFRHRFFLRPGETHNLPPMSVLPYAGNWHVAARFYRAWVDSDHTLIKQPDWIRKASGVQLMILKQQNGEIIWPYTKIDEMCDAADRRGIDILWFNGWGYGGHDHLYPDYNPCPLMGGEEGLRAAIKRAHERGKRVILYSNGQLQERGTAYWTTTGKNLAVTQRDCTTYQEYWCKYKDTPGYHFDIGCTASTGWRDRFIALARQAADFGADGLYVDQLACASPRFCYAEGHGHPVPSVVFAADLAEMLRGIERSMHAEKPEFTLGTEGTHDGVMDSISHFHGCTKGAWPIAEGEALGWLDPAARQTLFPEFYRYTYPELWVNVCNSQPFMNRTTANYVCAYGLRYEIMCRYTPDRRYLVEERMPVASDYDLILSKPNIQEITTLPYRQTADYLRDINAFRKRQADLLLTGTFVDTEGFSFTGKNVFAKGYKAGDQFGVLVWNASAYPAAFTVTVPSMAVSTASEPGRETVEPFAEIAPETVRLIRYQKP